MTRKLFTLFLMLFLGSYISGEGEVYGQQVAVKNNILYSATATLNAGIEVGISPHWSLDISGNFNAWSTNNQKKWKHLFIQPEARYWFCDRFSRHFVSAHLLAGSFNLGGLQNNISFLGTDFSDLSTRRYQGYAFGGGIGYGYAFMLSKHWNFELEGGFGYLFIDYEKFKCAGCGKKIGEGTHNYFGPTKMSVNLIYIF